MALQFAASSMPRHLKVLDNFHCGHRAAKDGSYCYCYYYYYYYCYYYCCCYYYYYYYYYYDYYYYYYYYS